MLRFESCKAKGALLFNLALVKLLNEKHFLWSRVDDKKELLRVNI